MLLVSAAAIRRQQNALEGGSARDASDPTIGIGGLAYMRGPQTQNPKPKPSASTQKLEARNMNLKHGRSP